MPTGMRLTVPSSDREGLSQLLRLSEGDLDRLIAAIRETPPVLRRGEFTSQVASKANISADAGEIVRVLTVLYSVRAETELSLSDFADVIRESVEQDQAFDGIKLSDDQWETFKVRLSTLLSLDHSLGVVAKAIFLLTDHPHVFHGARVFTDLRPVFGADPAQPPVAGVIVHQLKITYHEGDELKEFFVALESEELRRLFLILQRAETKARSLRSLVQSDAFPVLEGES